MDGDKVMSITREVPTVSGWVGVGSVLLLAIGSGLVVFAGLGLLVLAGGWTVRLALAGAGTAILVVWVVMVSRSGRLLLAREVIESGDPSAADATPVQTVTVEVMDPDAHRVNFLDLPMSADRLEDLARGLQLGRPFAEAEWTGAGRPFSKSDFRMLRSRLLEARLLAWRNADYPSQGITVTPIGRIVFGRLADGARTHAHASGGNGSRLLTDGQ